MKRKFIYVGLSECKQIIKVGLSGEVSTRVQGLRTDENKPFSLLFQSNAMSNAEAREIENKVNKQFKQYIVKGNEWYGGVKPIYIVEYLIDELCLEPYKIEEYKTDYYCWEETYGNYKTYFTSNNEVPYIKEKPSKGLFSIKYVSGGRFEYIGFCNYGDARKFYSYNKLRVEMAEDIIPNLYGIEVKDFNSLFLSTHKDIYDLRKRVKEVQETLTSLLKLIEI